MNVYLVRNPNAGSFNNDELNNEIAHAKCDVISLNLDQLETIPKGSRIIACGGDGTVSVVAWYASNHDCEMAVLPLGTGNDFARSQEISLKIKDGLKTALHSNNVHAIDLAHIDNMPVLNHASIGLATAANEAASSTKESIGAPSYAIGAVMAAVKEFPTMAKITIDNEVVWHAALWQVSIANTGRFGGGAAFTANDCDGMLDVYIFDATKKLDFFKRAWGLLFSELRDQDGVLYYKAREVIIEGEYPLTVNIDGDIHEFDKPVVCKVKPAALKVVLPEQLA